jgi:hypothetical protein
MSPTTLPRTTEITLSRDDRNNIPTGWIWAAAIIGFGVVLAIGGLSGELSQREAVADANVAVAVPLPP